MTAIQTTGDRQPDTRHSSSGGYGGGGGGYGGPPGGPPGGGGGGGGYGGSGGGGNGGPPAGPPPGGYNSPPPPNQNQGYGPPPTRSGGGGPGGLAIAALVLGIVTWVMGFSLLTAIPGAICGFIELGKIKKGESSSDGKWMAMVGMWVSLANIIIVTLLGCLFTVLIIAGEM